MKKNVEELKDQTIERLENFAVDLSKEIFELRNERESVQKLEKPHLIREKKKQRARVLTILSEKKKRA